MRPPRRLLDDGALPPALRADLMRARALPCAYDAGLGLAALQAALAGVATSASAAASAATEQAAAAAPGSAAPGAAAAPAGHASLLLGSAGAKLGLVVAGASVVAVGLFATAERTVPARAPQRPAQTVGDRGFDRAHPPELAVREPHRASVPAPPAEAAAASSAAEVPAPAAREPRHEIAQLGRIKALLARDPARAYRLAQQGHRTFARGVLRHEREGLAVLALFDLNRRPHAERRAHAFMARYPDSPLRAEIEQRLRAPERP
jgi:hypothetical protein